MKPVVGLGDRRGHRRRAVPHLHVRGRDRCVEAAPCLEGRHGEAIPRADGHRVRRRVRLEDVQRPLGADAHATPLPRGELPVPVVRSELDPVRVDDGSLGAPKPLASEKCAVVVTAEEARLLTLRPPCSCEAGACGLGSRLVLRLLAEREPDAVEERRIDGREHVRLVLLRVDAAPDQLHAVTLDDPRIVARPQLVGSRTTRKCHELVESKRAVATHARIGGLARRDRRRRTGRRSSA